MPSVETPSTPATTGKMAGNKESIKVLDDLMAKLTVSKEQEDINAATHNLAVFINGPIEENDAPTKTVEALKKQLGNKKDANVRERALNAIQAIAEHSETSASVEPYLVTLLPFVLAAVGDKMVPVKNAAQSAALAIVKAVNANAVKAVLPPIINSILTAQKWQEKITGLDCIEALVESCPIQLAFRVPDLIPVVSESMWDTKPEVKKRAYGTMEKVCGLIVNKDIERFIPELIKCIAKPENVPETVHLLGATTFVTDVHEPTLAIMVPLLDRGLNERDTAIKRKSAVIVDNMCKLVEDPNIVAAFLPKLMPGLNKNYDNLADPRHVKRPSKLLTPSSVSVLSVMMERSLRHRTLVMSPPSWISSRTSLAASTRMLSSSSQSSHTSPLWLVNSSTRRSPTPSAGSKTSSHTSSLSSAKRTQKLLSMLSESALLQVLRRKMKVRLMTRRVRIFATVPSTWPMVLRFS